MRNITCIAIDDEPMALLVIEQFCRRRGGMELLTFSEPHLGIEEIGRLRPDLVFLDIEMNGVSGLDIAAQLPRDCCLIFTTGHARYALDGFNLDAVDFLHKPFAYERFEMAVDKALRRIAQLRPTTEENLVVKQEYKSVSIPLDQILYIEALGNYCKIFCTDGHCILSHAGLKSLQSMLPAGRFLRIHRSYVVALDKVAGFNRTSVTFKHSDVSLPVGDSYGPQLLAALHA